MSISRDYIVEWGSRNSVVGLRAGWSGGSNHGWGKILTFFPKHPHQLSGATSLLFSGYRGLFPLVVKRPESEADHSPPSGAEVQNEQNCTFFWCFADRASQYNLSNLMYKFLFFNKFIIFLYIFRALLCSKNVEEYNKVIKKNKSLCITLVSW